MHRAYTNQIPLTIKPYPVGAPRFELGISGLAVTSILSIKLAPVLLPVHVSSMEMFTVHLALIIQRGMPPY